MILILHYSCCKQNTTASLKSLKGLNFVFSFSSGFWSRQFIRERIRFLDTQQLINNSMDAAQRFDAYTWYWSD